LPWGLGLLRMRSGAPWLKPAQPLLALQMIDAR
jgi:hypothetical protein